MEIIMNYRLSLQNETYPVEEIRIPAESDRSQELAGKHFSFISPVPLSIGQHCALLGDEGGYPLLVNACLGFTFSSRFLVSGIIASPDDRGTGTS